MDNKSIEFANNLLEMPFLHGIEMGISSDHIRSFNSFIDRGLSQIMSNTFTIQNTIKNERNDPGKPISTIHFVVKVNNVTVGYAEGKSATNAPITMYPQIALNDNKTYTAPVYADIEVVLTATYDDTTTMVRSSTVDHVRMLDIPIMIRSSRCPTANLSKEELFNIKEDPSDIGGQFIIKGVDWVINCIESTPYNYPKLFMNIGHANEVSRLEMICKPGDFYENSAQLFIKLLKNDEIIIIIDYAPYKTVEIPFYILFKLLGWTKDRKIVEWIASTSVDEHNETIMVDLEAGFHAKYAGFAQSDSVQTHDSYINSIIAAAQLPTEDARTYRRSVFETHLDAYLLPNIGTDISFRDEKARYLSILIRRLILVKHGIVSPTDRDNLMGKRNHPAGPSLAKAFKTHYNKFQVQPVIRAITNIIKNTQFSAIDIASVVKKAIRITDVNKSINQAVTVGTSTEMKFGNTTHINRLTSQMDGRKNPLDSAMMRRQINIRTSGAVSSQSTRDREMRSVPTTGTGYICVIQTQDGASVGRTKQIAVSTNVTVGSDSTLLKRIVLRSIDIIPVSELTPEQLMQTNTLTVNGHWIGSVRDSHIRVQELRAIRRAGDMDQHTTIHWDPVSADITLWCDIGRLVRPLIIVYNDFEPSDKPSNASKSSKISSKTGQYIKMTQKHLDGLKNGTITFADLVDQKIIEYITPDEQDNLMLAVNYETLIKNKHNRLIQYTHCDIPTAILGIPSLLCPYGAHSPTARTLLSTLQAKQACSYYSATWPYRIDKNEFLLLNTDYPIISTMANSIVKPTGENVIVAIASTTGYNQEDSIMINEAAVARGLFHGMYFKYSISEIDAREQFTKPDPTTTTVKSYANYDTINDTGFPTVGQVIHENDVVIGKVINAKLDDIIDKSVVYTSEEPAIVTKVYESVNQHGKAFVKVQLMVDRSVVIGDKFCLDDKHQVRTRNGWVSIKDVQLNDDIYTLDEKTNTAVFKPVLEHYKFAHNGPMFSAHGPCGTDMLTTLNHRTYVKNVFVDGKFRDTYGIIEARELVSLDSNNGNTVQYHNRAATFKTGSTLSNMVAPKLGSVDYRPNIDALVFCINAIGDRHKINQISHTNLRKYTDHALELNRVPKFMTKLSITDKQYLIRSLGDVSFTNNISAIICAIESIAIELGYSVRVTQGAVNKMRFIDSPDTTIHEHNMSIVQFVGSVYCVRVPGGIFLTRRGTTPVWTGNSMRSGQKGIAGALVAECDMPFTESGIVPDVIFNPHSLPSRMTLNTLMEILIGKTAAILMKFIDATMFRPVDISEMETLLGKLGFNSDGTETMYNGVTGRRIDTKIFIGPAYYQRLQKFVNDTIAKVQRGSTDPVTRQPITGKQGGLRVGEMEKDVLVSNGVSRFLSEKFYSHSDNFDSYICRTCGNYAIFNPVSNIYKCKVCENNCDIGKVGMSWTTKTLVQELHALNIGSKFGVTPYSFQERV